jgi:hypothetical protein
VQQVLSVKVHQSRVRPTRRVVDSKPRVSIQEQDRGVWISDIWLRITIQMNVVLVALRVPTVVTVDDLYILPKDMRRV